CLFCLHYRNRVSKAFQVFGETALVRAAKEPFGQRLRIVRRQVLVISVLCQFDHSSRPKHTIQLFVTKNLRKGLEKLIIKLHKPSCLCCSPRIRDWVCCSCGDGLPLRWHEADKILGTCQGTPLATLAQCPRSKPPDGLQATCSRRLRCRLIRGQEAHVQLFVCPLDK